MRSSRLMPATMLILVFGSQACAFSPGTLHGYVRPLDGQRVFVMRPGPEVHHGYTDQDKSILATYPRSGLYRKDQPDKPIWTIADNWYIGQSELWLSKDGVYLIVCTPPWEPDDRTRTARHRPAMLRRDAVDFYTTGQHIRAVTVREVVTNPSQIPIDDDPRKPEGYWKVWWVRSAQLDESALTFTVEAHDGTRTVFDIRTGNIVSQERPPQEWSERWVLEGRPAFLLSEWTWALGGGLLFIVAVGAWSVCLRRARRRRTSAVLPSPPQNNGPGPGGAGSQG
jgi:hypothetical protein